MFAVSTQPHGPSLFFIEGGLTAIAVCYAFYQPQTCSRLFRSVEHGFGQLARRKGFAVLSVGLAALLLRLALLPLDPIPHPFIHDGFSFLLAANTFASGRLTNPTPPMWQHFESFYVDMKPTYMSMYFPAQGLLLAAGKVLTGTPWYGLLLVTALMCAAICWMLQAWLPPSWALLGGCLAVLRLGLYSYWIDTYAGAGSVAALGGALVLGALPRLRRKLRLRYGVLLAIGLILMALSRPFEGLLLAFPVAAALCWWTILAKDHPPLRRTARAAVVPLLLIISAGAWLGYYNHRVFGSALTLPYTVNRKTYAMARYFIWQNPYPQRAYRHKQMQSYYQTELANFEKFRTVRGYVSDVFFSKPLRTLLFFAGFALLPALLFAHRALFDRRIRFLAWCLLPLSAGMLLEPWFFPHYLAPFTAIFYAIGLEMMRHLRAWRPGRRPVGLSIARSMVAICVVLAVARAYAQPLHLRLENHLKTGWSLAWFGPGPLGLRRARMGDELERLPGKQLAIVRYSASHNFLDEWVVNSPDIARAKVIWAHDMGPALNRELIERYGDRKVWLVEPDQNPALVVAYPEALGSGSANRVEALSAEIAR